MSQRERELESRLATAEAERGLLERERDEARRGWKDVTALSVATESRLATAEAENERLRADKEALLLSNTGLSGMVDAAETRLATAVGLLKMHATHPLHPDVRAFLASAQPAAPRCRYHADSMVCSECQPAAPARAEACEHGQVGYCGACCLLDEPVPTKPARAEAEPNTHSRGCVCARCEDEQAVLDAMAKVPEETLRRSLANTLHADEHSRAPARAELARREAAK